METIDYKQKIKDYMNSSEVDTLYKSMLNNLFPELAESEDEKIRKKIIALFKGQIPYTYAEDNKKFVAWLEKKGEKDKEILILKDQIESLHAAIKALIEVHKIELEKQGEQKPAWSEDDKHYYGIIQYILNNECVEKTDKQNAISWFQSLKDRVQPQNAWK